MASALTVALLVNAAARQGAGRGELLPPQREHQAGGVGDARRRNETRPVRALADTSKNICPVAVPGSTPDAYELPRETPVSPVSLMPTGASAPKKAEKQRRFPRVPCWIEAKACIAGSENWLRGTASDISVGGCHVEMISPLPVDAPVELVLAAAGTETHCRGVVRNSDTPFGMGIAFMKLNEDQREKRKQLVNSIQTEGQ